MTSGQYYIFRSKNKNVGSKYVKKEKITYKTELD